jgi:hypothetical protein
MKKPKTTCRFSKKPSLRSFKIFQYPLKTTKTPEVSQETTVFFLYSGNLELEMLNPTPADSFEPETLNAATPPTLQTISTISTL